MFSKIKITGHPIHPMLVPFPIVFYTSTLVGFIIYSSTGDLFWYRAAITANIAGVAMAVIAAVPGMLDFINIPRGRTKMKGFKHMISNIVALVFFTANAIIYGMKWNDRVTDSIAPIIICSLGMIATVVAGFYGWEMVQRHHVGVDLNKEQEKLEPENEIDVELARRRVY